MENDERIYNAKNRVFTLDALGIGKNNPISLHTVSDCVYRVTGMDQIYDIIATGYVRPKMKVKGGHRLEVFWSKGGKKLFYYDKRPVLEVPIDKVSNNQIGAVSINDLSAIWVFDESQNSYVNLIDHFLELHEAKKNDLRR